MPYNDRLKIGLDSTFHNISSAIYSYKSMLTYDPDVNNSLLQVLWLNQVENKREKECVKILTVLVDIVTSDPDVMEYFASLPGVTYQYARYTDWIKPYLAKTLNTSGAANTLLREAVTKIISKYEIYDAYLISIDGIASEEE